MLKKVSKMSVWMLVLVFVLSNSVLVFAANNDERSKSVVRFVTSWNDKKQLGGKFVVKDEMGFSLKDEMLSASYMTIIDGDDTDNIAVWDVTYKSKFSKISSFPVVSSCSADEFIGWVDENGKKVNEKTAIGTNSVYYAVFKKGLVDSYFANVGGGGAVEVVGGSDYDKENVNSSDTSDFGSGSVFGSGISNFGGDSMQGTGTGSGNQTGSVDGSKDNSGNSGSDDFGTNSGMNFGETGSIRGETDSSKNVSNGSVNSSDSNRNSDNKSNDNRFSSSNTNSFTIMSYLLYVKDTKNHIKDIYMQSDKSLADLLELLGWKDSTYAVKQAVGEEQDINDTKDLGSLMTLLENGDVCILRYQNGKPVGCAVICMTDAENEYDVVLSGNTDVTLRTAEEVANGVKGVNEGMDTVKNSLNKRLVLSIVLVSLVVIAVLVVLCIMFFGKEKKRK